MYWQAIASGGLNGGIYSCTLYLQGQTTFQNFNNLFVLKRSNVGSNWQLSGVAGTNSGSNVNPVVLRNSLSGFSEFSFGEGIPNNPLPITLLSFTGKRQDERNVLLEWKTAQEFNNQGFEIKFSENGQNFNKVAFVNGKGNSQSIVHYDMKITNPEDGYYRLKQLDFDEKFAYSHFIFVEGQRTKPLFNVYPNPTSDYLTISLEKNEEKIIVYFIDEQGRKVREAILTSSKNEISLTHLPKGNYFVCLNGSNKINICKIIIQ